MNTQDIKFSVPGFFASATHAGLSKKGIPDLSLIVSENRSVTAGVFTENLVKAAPVLLTRERVQKGFARAIIANSGCANACTGSRGFKDAVDTADIVARELGIEPEEVLVASTGVIGAYLPLELIKNAVPELVKNLSSCGFESVAKALMTTDSFPKMSYREGVAGGKDYRILGLAKGAGMIMPNMATMLSFIMTDLRIDHQALCPPFRSVVDKTFNRITVDGDTSTNDMVLIMANGYAENEQLSLTEVAEFENLLKEIMGELSYMIAEDGEGATKVLIVEVNGAATKHDAEKAARTVGNSSLVKTAVFGRDPNWGRIMAALGRCGVEIEEKKVDIWINGVKVVEGGLMVGISAESEARKKMEDKEVLITVNLKQGNSTERIITCDLTYDYVRINADYRT